VRQTFSFEGQVTREDLARPYIYLPFTVPPRTARLEVSYQFEHRKRGDFGVSGGNNLDLGIFDARGTDFLTGGFRGWSGGARSSIYLTPTSSTPGYLPGPLTPGRWNVLLGVAELEDPSCRYWLNVGLDVLIDGEEPEAADLSAGQPALSAVPAAGSRRQPDRAAGEGSREDGRWYRGDLHSHTVHSDGLNTVRELAAYARERGLDFLAITDHNTCSHHAEMALLRDPGILLVPGEEVTTYRGHANVWGLREWLDFRCADNDTIRRVMEHARKKGVLFSVNHPKSVGPPWEFASIGAPCMEVWQAPWRWYNWESLDAWERLLAGGQRVIAVGGSDCHTVPPARPTHPHGPGEPTTWVYLTQPLNEAALLKAIGRGHVFISEDPGGPTLTLQADADGDGRFEHMVGDTVDVPEGSRVTVRVQYRGLAGKKVRLLRGREVIEEVVADAEEVTRDLPLVVDGPGYLRAEVRGTRGRPERGEVVHAMTNPLYLRPRPS
jgi:hypothetical protein